MKPLPFLIVTFAAIALPFSASAQIDLTWDNCALAAGGEPAPTIDKTFDCATPSRVYKAHGSFKTPIDVPTFYGIEAVLDIMFTANDPPPSLNPFWHFEAGGCNASGIVISADRSQSGGIGGGCGAFASPWGDLGEGVVLASYVYQPDYHQPGRGRMIALVLRSPKDPFPLQANTNYYGFHLRWRMAGSASCAGCADPMVMFWSSATLSSDDAYEIHLSGPTNKVIGYFLSINDGIYYIRDPVVATTWGQIKTQYR